MSITAEGISSIHLDALQRMIAASPVFQAWTGAADATAAMEHIYIDAFEPEDLEGARPFVLIEDGELDDSAYAGGGGQVFHREATFNLIFDDNVLAPSEELPQPTNKDQGFHFRNQVEGVLADFEALAGTGDYVYIKGIRQIYPMTRTRKTKGRNEDAFYWGFEVRIGLGA